MANIKKNVDKRVNAFRSEVDMLRNVIRNTVNDVMKERFEDVESLKKRQKLIQTSLRKAETTAAPLQEKIARLESGIENIGKTGMSSSKGFEKDINKMIKGGKNIEGILEGIVESKLRDFNNKILMLRREIDMVRGEMNSSKTKKLEEELERCVGSLKSEIADIAVERQNKEEIFDSEIEKLKGDMEVIGKLGEHTDGVKMGDILRDMEIIKTKQEWIENNIERIDIKPLMRKIEELEHRIRVMNVSSPIILE